MAILMFGMHFMGASVVQFYLTSQSRDQVIPTLMVQVLPPFAAGIF